MMRFAPDFAGLAGIVALFGLAVQSAPAAPVEFNRDVRPILSDRCFNCHGPDAKNKNIALRLDVEAAAKSALPSGRRAIVPRDPAASELIQRITAERPARRMPPPATGHTLTPKEVATLREWIAQGAEWQAHWSFIRPTRPALPAVANAEWPRQGLDRFVLARLDREQLKPSPEASKETWLRRATLDLTGVPPSLKELDTFLADSSPAAYERAADRILASPRYGERMAARWIEAARYADTNGYQFDGERQMWRWRDWVIQSFNANQPFNQFVLEQLAGDLLPNATLNQVIATGFNRNHRGNTEDGIIPEEYAVEYVADRVETTSTVFLGLTIGCTRCHNHKYDPFTQKEFYQLFAYFNNVPENGRAMKYGNSPPYIPAPTGEEKAKLDELDAKIAAARASLERQDAEIAAAQQRYSGAPLKWTPRSGLDLEWNPTPPGDALPKAFDEAKSGFYDIRDHFTLAAKVTPPAGTTPQGALLTKMSMSTKGRGETAKGYGVHFRDGRIFIHFTSVWETDALKLQSRRTFSGGQPLHVAVTYDGSVSGAGIALYVNGEAEPLDVLQDNLYRPLVNAGGVFNQKFRIGAGGGPENQFAGKIEQAAVWSRVLTADELLALAKPGAKPAFARNAFLATAQAPAEARATYARLESLQLERERFTRTLPTVMVMAELPKPRETHLLIRGAYDKPGEVVQPGVPAALPPLAPSLPNNRLGFAKWVIDPANPLTARVAVNRLWQMLFGVGIVKTSEDFGSQGEWPSHPELLDWLAMDFVESGWDVKATLKKIVLSAAYRQSSKASPELLQRDPENRLIARGPRFRMPAEMIRDSALFSAGLLVDRIGGPSVKPYQPDGLWKETSMQDMPYVQAKGSDLYRRSLYTFWKRTIAPPMMVNFDSANHESCVVRDNRTNTPLQALNLMNDVTFIEASRKLGERMIMEGGATPDQRVRHGFRIATGRAPKPAEEQVLRGSLQYHLDYFSDESRAAAMLKQGDSPAPASIPSRELAAYTAVASLLLNLDESITKE